jgi:hypothetical protein
VKSFSMWNCSIGSIIRAASLGYRRPRRRSAIKSSGFP